MSYKHLTHAERFIIETLNSKKYPYIKIAEIIGRHPSTVWQVLRKYLHRRFSECEILYRIKVSLAYDPWTIDDGLSLKQPGADKLGQGRTFGSISCDKSSWFDRRDRDARSAVLTVLLIAALMTDAVLATWVSDFNLLSASLKIKTIYISVN
jgi:hypothetical protein